MWYLFLKEWPGYTLDDQDSTMIIKEDFAYIIREHTARAAMARPSDTGQIVTQLKDKSVIVMDCGASRTVTGSLLNSEHKGSHQVDYKYRDSRWKGELEGNSYLLEDLLPS